MKKKVLLCGLIIAVVLSGCGKNKKESQDVAQVEDSTNIPESSKDSDDSDGEKSNDNEKSEDADESKQYDKTFAMETIRTYQRFLNNNSEVKLNFDIEFGSQYDTWTNIGYKDAYANKETTFSEFLGIFCKTSSEYEDGKIEPHDIRFAFLDCGNDGIPELAITFNDVMKYETPFTDLFIIKYLDDKKLHLMFWDEFGYRTYGYLTEYGIYYNGGSSGAVVNDYSEFYINEEGEAKHVYSNETIYALWGLYIPDNDEYMSVADEQGMDDELVIEQVCFEPCGSDEEYKDYLKRSMWTYYENEESVYDGREEKPEIYENDSPYRIFWNSTKLPLVTPSELDEKIKEREESLGITEEISDGTILDWIELGQDIIDQLYLWKTGSVKQYVMENPSWDYYIADADTAINNKLILNQISSKENSIINDYEWFDEIGCEQPQYNAFSDGKYNFELYGGETYYPYMMNIIDGKTGETLYNLDFSNYYMPDYYQEGDGMFVTEAIRWARIKDDILYVCTAHNTYASSANHNAYITAFDMKNDFKPIWKSEPLISNANNFEIYEDYIICGYGFTNEDDFVYVLDRNTGKKVGTYKVKTGPDYFYINGNKLYVRTYNTDYVYELVLQ